MSPHSDAIGAFKELEGYLEESKRAVATPVENPLQAPAGVSARDSLIGTADVVSTDAQKFTLVFMNSAPPPEDAMGLCRHVRKGLEKFVAWCSALGGESPAMHRAVAVLAEEVLTAVIKLVQRTVELNLQKDPEPFLVGAVIEGVNAMKKLPKNQANAVQKQLVKDAGAVKSVVSDLEEMIAENTEPGHLADKLDELGVNGAAPDPFAGADDVMNMSITLSSGELRVAQASLKLVQCCMCILKTGVRGLAPLSDNFTGPQPHFETLAEASSIFTRAAEDLGALACLDQTQCKGEAEKLMQALNAAGAALQTILGSLPPDAQQALADAESAFKLLP
mmetsp:Transcript_5244/g.13217  ORF Transcript_5244/g.13217 Transcript_5244/m.13217 type:complete len:335 (-) Transcript_5244:2308-3312(-)